METIIVKPKTQEESEQVLRVLKQMQVETEIYRDRTKKEILDSIERGAEEVAAHLAGKTKLRNIKDLLDEL